MTKRKKIQDEAAQLLQEIKNAPKENQQQAEQAAIVDNHQPNAPENKRPMKQPVVTDVSAVTDETLIIFNFIRDGFTKAEIRTMHAAWPDKKFETIYKRALKLMQQNVQDVEQCRADLITKYYDLYKRSNNIGNLKMCKEILDSLCKVLGVTRDVNVSAEIVTMWKP